MSSRRFYEIDLLRFLAAFAVVMFHYCFRGHAADNLSDLAYPWLVPVAKYGSLGVNLFFLISGFVILMSASGGSQKQFVISRVVRLYPAYWVCCLISFVVLTATVAGARRHVPDGREFMINLTMLGGFFNVPYVDSAYWSLLIEMKFYLLVFLVLLFRQIHRANVLLGLWLGLVLIMTKFHIKYVSFFLFPEYAPYFIAGATFFLIARDGLTFYRGGVVAICAVLSVMRAIQLDEAAEHFRTTFSPAVVGGLVLTFYVLFLAISLGHTRAFGSAKWVAFGALTYPLYLIHQNIGFVLFNHLAGRVNPHLLLWSVVALMIAAAYVVTRIERWSAPQLKRLLQRALSVAPAPRD